VEEKIPDRIRVSFTCSSGILSRDIPNSRESSERRCRPVYDDDGFL